MCLSENERTAVVVPSGWESESWISFKGRFSMLYCLVDKLNDDVFDGKSSDDVSKRLDKISFLIDGIRCSLGDASAFERI